MAKDTPTPTQPAQTQTAQTQPRPSGPPNRPITLSKQIFNDFAVT